MPTALIIGGSRGLGRGLVEEHLKRGWQVIATVRKPEALHDLQQSAGEKLEVELLDTTDWDGVDALRMKLRSRPLDLIFVNAGISGPMEPIGDLNRQAFFHHLDVNALAPLRIVDRFADLLTGDGVAAVMSSHLGSIGDNESGGFDSYRISKAALNMGMRSVAGRRGAGGRTYLCIAPGWVRTDMGGPGAPLGIEESIPRIVDILEQRRGTGGSAFLGYDGTEVSW